MDFGTVLYETKGRVPTITLNRPERMNAIGETMPEEVTFKQAIAERDSGGPTSGSKN